MLRTVRQGDVHPRTAVAGCVPCGTPTAAAWLRELPAMHQPSANSEPSFAKCHKQPPSDLTLAQTIAVDQGEAAVANDVSEGGGYTRPKVFHQRCPT